MASKFNLIVTIALMLALAACKKSEAPKPTPAIPAPAPLPVTNADVYVAGTVTAANGKYVATYWKNGIATTLADSSINSVANAITTQGSNICIAGEITLANGSAVAVYWKNGVPVYAYGLVYTSMPGLGTSTGTAYSSASAIAVHGNDVYIAGITFVNINRYEIPTWWKNGVPCDTLTFYNGSSGDPNTAELNAIAVQGDTICTAGSVQGTFNLPAPFYTQGDFSAALYQGQGYADAFGIALKGTDVYVAGYMPGLGLTVSNAVYWKNGIPVKLAGGSLNTLAYAITLQGTDVFVAGYTAAATGHSTVATYWKNGLSTTISTGANFKAIAVSGSDIYLAGQNSAGYAAYWINGVVAQLAGKGSSANGIALISK